MPNNSQKTGKRKVETVRRKLLSEGLARVQISVILLLTAAAGFLTSYFLLQTGVSSMTLRYPLAIIAAYCVFLLLLRIWLWLQKSRLDFDLPDAITGDFGSASSTGGTNFEFGGGADFGGAGAGGSWGESLSSSTDSGKTSFLDGAGFDLDLDELGWIILAVVVLLGAILAVFYVIYIAPVLLAEILMDGLLVSGLYRRVKKIEQRYWLKTAVKKTLVPAVLVTIFFTVAGFALQKAVPEAKSIGEVWKNIGNR